MPVITILASQAMIYFYELYKNKIYKIFIVVSLVCLLLFSQVLFLPKNSYALEVETPQPPFEDAYTYVKENIVEGDILIVTQPAISALYFKKADYWLAIGYEGRGINDLYNKNNLGERYTNITSIINEIMLKDALAYGGYIIIDPNQEYEDVIRLTNGVYVRLTPDSNVKINILDCLNLTRGEKTSQLEYVFPLLFGAEKSGVFSGRTHCELVHIGLADKQSAARFQLLNDESVVGRDIIFQDLGSGRRFQPFH